MTDTRSSPGSAVAWQFRQRSGVGKGPQSQAPWGEWCGIDREVYEMYLEAPNKLVEVRALTVLGAAQAAPEPKEITMQDVRLLCGEGKLENRHVLNAVNAIIKRRAEMAQLLGPAYGLMERLPVEKLARHFRVSVAQAQDAQNNIGFMYRELASPVPSTEGNSRD